MATVTTARVVNLPQLSQEMGGKALGAATNDDGTTTIRCYDSTTTSALQAAVDGHVALPPPPSETALLQQQINELTDLFLFGY